MSNKGLIDKLRQNALIKSDQVYNAMISVDRAEYCPGPPKVAYEDSPSYLGYDATISAPHMHAICLENMVECLKEGSRVLDIGSGSGYLSAVLGLMVGSTGKVFGIEHVEELVSQSVENIRRDNPQLLDSGVVKIMCKDGRTGLPQYAPFDAIHVGAAAKGRPDTLLYQLAVGGILISPVEDPSGQQTLIQYRRNNHHDFSETFITHVRYVPLTDMKLQKQSADLLRD